MAATVKTLLFLFLFFCYSLCNTNADDYYEDAEDGDFVIFVETCNAPLQKDCSLSCMVNASSDDDYNNYELIDYRWTYYTTDEDVNVTIYKKSLGSTDVYGYDANCEDSKNGESFSCSLTISAKATKTKASYYAGYYRCFFSFQGPHGAVENHHDFKIDNTTDGAEMDGSCVKASDCLALYANCNDSKGCICENDQTAVNSDADNPACLPQVDIGDGCDLEEQCERENEMRHCVEERCTCEGQQQTVDGTSMCLAMSTPFGQCLYDESCRGNSDDVAFCNDEGVCQCSETATLGPKLEKCIASSLTITTDHDNINPWPSEGCHLSCTVTAPSDDYAFISVQWSYVIAAGASESIELFNVSSTTNEDTYKTTLTITQLNSGLYICHFVFNASGELSDMISAFNLSSAVGVLLGEECSKPEECAAFNAQCSSNGTCECGGANDIASSLNADAAGCLNYVENGGQCNIDQQCYQENEKYLCSSNVCTCNGSTFQISETGQQMCIYPVKINYECVYSEQCYLADSTTDCINHICQCSSDYEYSDSTFTCEKTLSGGAIAGIVIGCLVAVVAIAIVVVFLIKK